ncbi:MULTISPECIES: Lrp/AsnC family transcriptional regulator [Citrobacter]|uniref:Lrp/AsnC family transcriptional regulator n=1 Tax=Citrobacter TaxID=544 RepID=UPI0015E9C83C|nr:MULTISPECIES: Lrp/AsnC family transcriptional regulator [Citrobacter]HCL6053590.1 Lrp/AsnC family transcriptional regulator [Raoultella ornithinolytica]MBJ9840218.1 Lrp/AsnC family transcriptional regulator [Citrobacter freundii]MCY3420021.1 Lrp/AsnC family transcriptional regulator [Citrobacter freundii]MDE8815677.1 Lrp/AsnC family transcriptional regulator [Citrobacter freundii]MDE8821699.1 Lrp/AsnC family transcriptional regulator [Citrobacter freundii]
MLDGKDKELLRLLQIDCTISLDGLASAVSITPHSCRERINRLKDDGVITGQVALLDKCKLNMTLTAFVMIKTQYHHNYWNNKLESKISHMPEVMSFFRITGKYDYIVTVSVIDMHGYDKFYKKLLELVGEVSYVKSIFSMEEIKNITQLPIL